MTKEHQGDWRRKPRVHVQWEAAIFRKVARSSLLLILVFSAVLGCSAQPSVAMGTCGCYRNTRPQWQWQMRHLRPRCRHMPHHVRERRKLLQ